MISISDIKKIPEFELLSEKNKALILKSYISAHVDEYDELSETDKNKVEGEVLNFYGIDKNATESVVNSSAEKIREHIEKAVKKIGSETMTAIGNLSQKIENAEKIGPELENVKQLLAENKTVSSKAIEKIKQQISKNKPKDVDAKLEELRNSLNDNMNKISLAVNNINFDKKLDEINASLVMSSLETQSKIEKSLKAKRQKIEPASKQKVKRLLIERDHMHLITEIIPVYE